MYFGGYSCILRTAVVASSVYRVRESQSGVDYRKYVKKHDHDGQCAMAMRNANGPCTPVQLERSKLGARGVSRSRHGR